MGPVGDFLEMHKMGLKISAYVKYIEVILLILTKF